ncbi:MAG: magnesium transporter [Clostridiales bacterium]|nr:magnesium transporter [Clostridiales bacterium]
MNAAKNVFNENLMVNQHPDYRAEIVQVIRSNLTPRRMQEQLLSYHGKDVAEAMELLRSDERRRLYSILDGASLAEILEYSDRLKDFLGELSLKKRVEILTLLEPATAVDYLQQLDKAQRNTLIELMPQQVQREVALLSSFNEDEIGSKMTTNYIAIRAGLTVRQAMKELVAQAAENDNISTIYVVDEEGVLLGAIDLKDLIIARENTALDAIMMSAYPYVYANELIEDCIEQIKNYSEDSIPVLDGENRLRGVLTAQDIALLIGDELGEDYAKFAGLSAEEDLREPLKKSICKRLPWLIVLLGLGIVVSFVVGLFERVVAHVALIVCFQSLVLDMAGNVGTQSLAVTIRVLMDEQTGGRQKLYLVGKEARVGLVNGLILGLLSFGLIGAYLMLFKGQSAVAAFSLSLCTGAALLISMILSSVSGTVVPIFFKKLGVDPAVASGPLITTINDLVAVVSYYGLAWVLLINVLGL